MEGSKCGNKGRREVAVWAGGPRGQGGLAMLGRRLKGAGQVPLRATHPASSACCLWMVALALPLKGAERGGESVSVHQPGCFINAPSGRARGLHLMVYPAPHPEA